MLTSYFVKYLSVPSLSDNTNLLLRNWPLSRPLFINMPSRIPAESQHSFQSGRTHTHTPSSCLSVCVCTHLPRMQRSLWAQKTPSSRTLPWSTAPSTPWTQREEEESWSGETTALYIIQWKHLIITIVFCGNLAKKTVKGTELLRGIKGSTNTYI